MNTHRLVAYMLLALLSPLTAQAASPQGPAPIPIELRDLQLTGDGTHLSGVEDLQELLPFQSRVYPDLNPESLVFYYVPYRYRLDHDASGYALDIRYRQRHESGNNATFTAMLASGIDARSRDLIKRLIAVHLQERLVAVSHQEIELLPFPGDLVVDINWGPIARGDIQLAPVATLDDRIALTFTTDTETARVFADLIRETGVFGKVRVMTDGAPAADLQLALDRAGNRAVPFMPHTELEFRNEMPLAVRLHHVLYLYDTGRQLHFGAYELAGPGAGRLSPGDIAEVSGLFGSEFPSVDSLVGAWWLYDVEDDAAARDGAIEALFSGASGADVTQDTINIIGGQTALESLGINRVYVEVQSQLFDPHNRTARTNAYELDGSNEITMDPIYLRSSPQHRYLYRLSVVRANGVTHQDRGWRVPPTPEDILVGRLVLEEVLAQ